MRAIVIDGGFGLEHLKEVERERPSPRRGQVLLKMRACSINYRDLLMVKGHYNPRQPLPLVPLSDGVGEVVEVGEGVDEAMVGRRVCPIFAQGWLSGEPSKAKLKTTLGGPLDGVLAEYAAVDAASVVEAPDYLTDEEAATLPCAAVTAWSALVEQGGVTAGDTVLVQGTGGVSIFALQLATMLGARVVVTSSKDEKLERAEGLGARWTINYREEPQWGRLAARLVGGEGVDHVIEVGGAGTLAQSLAAVRVGGHISMIGVLSGASEDLSVIPILMRQIRVQGVLVGHKEGFGRMVRAMAAHEVRPVVDRVFGWREVAAALGYMESQRHFGKICLTFD